MSVFIRGKHSSAKQLDNLLFSKFVFRYFSIIQRVFSTLVTGHLCLTPIKKEKKNYLLFL